MAMAGIASLVAHVDEVVAFFDEMFGPKHCPADWDAAASLEKLVRQLVDFQRYDAERRGEVRPVMPVGTSPVGMTPKASAAAVGLIRAHWQAHPKLKALLDAERSRIPLLVRWQCDDFLHHAIQQTLLDGAACGRRHGSGDDLVPEGIAQYLALLERREELIDSQRLRPLFVGAIRDAMRGDSHAGDAVKALRHEWARLFDDDFDGDWRAGFTTAGQWRIFRRDLLAALETARIYGAALTQQTEVDGDGDAANDERGKDDTDGSGVVEPAADDVHRMIARRIKGKNLAVLTYLHDRNAISASENPAKRDLAAEALKHDGIAGPVDVKNAVAAIRGLGAAHGLELVESADSGVWLTPDGRKVASLVARPAATKVALCRGKARGG